MMSFSTGTGLERVGDVGPELGLLLGWSAGSGHWTLLQKQETRRVGGGFARCRSDASVSSSLRENIDCLETNVFAYLSSVGWPVIYSICFSQLDGSKDSFPLDGVSFAFIVIGLIKG